MTYSKDDARELDQMLDRTAGKRPDVTEAPLQQQVKMLHHLVAALETCLHIVHKTHYADPAEPEPFPGATKAVVKQSIVGIRLARNSGLIP